MHHGHQGVLGSCRSLRRHRAQVEGPHAIANGSHIIYALAGPIHGCLSQQVARGVHLMPQLHDDSPIQSAHRRKGESEIVGGL